MQNDSFVRYRTTPSQTFLLIFFFVCVSKKIDFGDGKMSFNILSGMMMIYGSRQHMHFIKRKKKQQLIGYLYIIIEL